MTAAPRILLVDDELALQRTMAPLLRARGFAVTLASTGRGGIDSFEQEHPDLVILDLGLPDIEGGEVCALIRGRAETPILILSARGAERDKVAALDRGADDYVTKPFGPDELLARVRALLRRAPNAGESPHGHLVRGHLDIDFDRRRVRVGNVEARLTPREFDLLTVLATHSGRVMTHRALSKELWGPRFTDQPEHLRVLIGQLRKKIEPDPANPKYVLTEPWVGYRFAED